MHSRMFTASDFCRATGLSRHALLAFESQGLLSPGGVLPESGQPCYTEEQARRGALLAFLRNFDIPAADIAQLLGGEVSLKEYFGRTKTREDLFQRRQKIDQMLRALALCDTGELAVARDIIIRSMPEQPVFSLMFQGHRRDIPSGIARILEFANEHGARCSGPAFISFPGDPESEPIRGTICCPVEGYWNLGHGEIGYERYPASHLAVVHHIGPWESVALAYRRLGVYLKSRSGQTTGDTIETYINAGDRFCEPSLFVTEVGAVLSRTELSSPGDLADASAEEYRSGHREQVPTVGRITDRRGRSDSTES